MNPWLDIPLAGYEGHMALPEVGQADYLASTLARLVRDHAPSSVAIIGCAGGNGFDGLADVNVTRVVGVDINAAFLAEAKRRYSGSLRGLELLCCDIASARCLFERVDLIFAALVFEYLNVPASLVSLRRLLRPGGLAAVILQLPHSSMGAVTPSPFSSLAKLAPVLRPVPPAEFQKAAEQAGFRLKSCLPHVLPLGKAFQEIFLHAR